MLKKTVSRSFHAHTHLQLRFSLTDRYFSQIPTPDTTVIDNRYEFNDSYNVFDYRGNIGNYKPQIGICANGYRPGTTFSRKIRVNGIFRE